MPSYYNDEYDIEKAFATIEQELISSMIRNLDRHRAEETKLGYNWEQWQVVQLQALERYKRDNIEKFQSSFSNINSSVDVMIRAAREAGSTEQEQKILRAIKKGYKPRIEPGSSINGEFFKLSNSKLEALIKATTDDMKKAEYAMLRMSNDKYRQIIFNAQVYFNSGAGTYEKAVDMATKDFLRAGINCIEYKDGSRHNIKSYSKMAIKTANTRAYLAGEGAVRKAYGVSTVYVDKNDGACPKCARFVGKILIDDVWSGGKQEDGDYPLMSQAIAAGMYHPNCKCIHTTYYPGITKRGDKMTSEEMEELRRDYEKEQRRNYAAQQAEKLERMATYSLDKDNKRMYAARAEAWQKEVENYNKILEAPSISDIAIKKYQADFINKLKKSDGVEKHVSNMMLYSENTEYIEDYTLDAPFQYLVKSDVIAYNSKAPYFENYDMNFVQAHELSHRMDLREYNVSGNAKFKAAIEICRKKVLNKKEEIQQWFKDGGKYEDNFPLSDIISALSNNSIKVCIGHKTDYWNDEENIVREIFANISSIDILNNEAKIEFGSLLKEIYEAYKEIVR